jgi:hypothetical protein
LLSSTWLYRSKQKGNGKFRTETTKYFVDVKNSVLDFETKTFVFILAYTYGQEKPKNSLPISMLIFLNIMDLKDQISSEFVLIYDLK